MVEIKVFKLNSYEWWAGPDLDSIRRAYKEQTGVDPDSDEGFDNPRELVPQSSKWLVWDKEQTMPSYSDAELAWTNLNGTSTKMFRYCASGLLALEKERYHPTQKPVSLMKWCISLVPEVQTIIDPYMGSGSVLRAAKDLGRKAIGIEISEEYCAIAVERLRQGVLQFA